ncbi:hypothetical protein KFK09_012279 [Dendrobium nobile]|uniref:BED-type domain-containing protein n=1 Tax=Dendrobium nobile TaxID=94219 RepID=A0A8T3BEW1_DENNO|nr:hypothetical protein KFK09_012279 [Dendrobium nobile]
MDFIFWLFLYSRSKSTTEAGKQRLLEVDDRSIPTAANSPVLRPSHPRRTPPTIPSAASSYLDHMRMEASGTQSAASSSSVREKVDIAWNHFSEIKDAEGKRQFKCLHCSIVYKGGGINRMKQHLAGVKGNIAACKKVPHDIRFQMQENLKDISKRKQQVQEELESTPFPIDAEVDEGGDSSSLPKSQSSEAYQSELAKGKRKLAEIDTFFAPRTKSGSQPSIKSVLASKEAVHRADLAVARWFFDCCIPFNAINSPYAQKAVDAITAIGPGYKLPSYHNMRVNLLKDCKEECRLLIDCYRNTWKDTGCTLMADGWTDGRSRTLINFMIYCPRGISFLKSVDASDIVKDATNLCSLFSEVVEWVGPENIVQLVTDNAANYKKAGELLKARFNNIYWSPCGAHCLNFILKDLGSIPLIENLAKKVSKVTIFAYNHVYVLAWLRKRQGWKEIVRPGATRFATTFITLKSVCEHKHDLQALITSKFYADSKIAKTYEWWKMFGSSAPNLQKVAIRILSQTSSSSGCERNWSIFEQIHSKRRNHLEHQRLNDLVYVRYNLNLKDRFQLKKRSYDPLDYTCVEMVDFWVLDEESPPDLALEELETEIYEEASMPIVEEANIASTQPTPGELENEGDGDDIIDFNDLGAFVAADFDEAGHEDLNNEVSIHNATLGDI